MDWLISPVGSDPATRTTKLLAAHLRRHAAEPDAVDKALADVHATLAEALRARPGPVRVHLDWTAARPSVELSALDDEAGLPADLAPDLPVPGRHRDLVEERAGAPFVAVDLPVERRVQETFRAGPPPTPLVDVDPRRDGPASVAVALVAAVDAHPTVSGPQAASLAGAILAEAVADSDTRPDAQDTARLIAEVHGALGSDAEVEVTEEGDLEMTVSHCPFGPGVVGAASLCHVTAGLAGQLAARVHGEASVVVDEAIAAGDPECHLVIRLQPGDEEVRGQNHQWPKTATARTEPAPHLDLSLSLPRESSSVPVVRRLAAQALRAFGVHDGDIADVQLAITEACANVVEHATDADTYEVKVELAADRCAITVVDQGRGFDATAAADPPPADPDAESGRGLMLMRALVDNLAFQSEPQAGAVVHMVKSLRFDDDHPLWRREDSADRETQEA